MPLVSIIVPVYKVEPFLRDCIDSILKQSFKDFELLLIDDGSPDNCPAICDEYAKKDNRIIVIHKENGGLSSARNAGLEYVFVNSNSEFVAFIDSDDYVSNDYLIELINNISDCGFVMCYCQLFNSDGPIVEQGTMLDGIFDNLTYWKDCDFYFNKVTSCNKLFRKELFKNIRFPEGKIHEDEFIIHKLVEYSKTINIIPKAMYYYRRRDGSITDLVSVDYDDEFKLRLDIFIDRIAFYCDVSNKKRALDCLWTIVYMISTDFVSRKKGTKKQFNYAKKQLVRIDDKYKIMPIKIKHFFRFPSVYLMFKYHRIIVLR